MYDLKGHIRLNKVLYIYSFSLNNSSAKPTLPLMFPQIACALLSAIPTKRERDGSFFFSLDVVITTLTYVVMDNFCPCFIIMLVN